MYVTVWPTLGQGALLPENESYGSSGNPQEDSDPMQSLFLLS